MATIKSIETNRNWGVRPSDNVIDFGFVWKVKKGEQYDLVEFTINELGNKPYYWAESLCVPIGMTDKEIEKIVKDYVKTITDEDIKNYKEFLEDGERWGWD